MSNAQKFLSTLKTIAKNQNEREMGLHVLYGTVISVNPLKIKVDNRFIIDENFIILTTNVIEKTLNLSHNHGGTNALTSPVVVIPGLSLNEGVMLLRIENGQKFVVLDRI